METPSEVTPALKTSGTKHETHCAELSSLHSYRDEVRNITAPSALLSNDQLAAFRENGYLILREVLDPHTCQNFDKVIVQPALLKHAGIDEKDPKTFHSSINLLHSFATGEFKKINDGRCSSSTTSTGTSTSTQNYSKASTISKSTDPSRNRDIKDKSDAKNNYTTIENDEYFLPGVMIRMPNGEDPIPDKYCLDMSPLNSILDQLHNDGDQIYSGDDNDNEDGEDGDVGAMKSYAEVMDAGVSADPTATATATGTRNWEWLHSNLGWIHVRFPCVVPNSISKSNPKEANPLNDDDRVDLHASSYRSWHVDGGHFTPHHLNSREQSVIVLPMIRDVAKGGGNTMVLKRSHIYMAQKLHAADSNSKGAHTTIHHVEGKVQDGQQNSVLGDGGGGGIPREETQNANDIAAMWPDDLIVEMAPCGAGDVLLMHPFLVHAAGIAEIGHPMRIAFNMGVRWTRDVHVGSNIEDEHDNENKDGIDNDHEGYDMDANGSYHRTRKQRCCSPLEEMIGWCLHQKLSLGSSTTTATTTTILDDAFKEE